MGFDTDSGVVDKLDGAGGCDPSLFDESEAFTPTFAKRDLVGGIDRSLSPFRKLKKFGSDMLVVGWAACATETLSPNITFLEFESDFFPSLDAAAVLLSAFVVLGVMELPVCAKSELGCCPVGAGYAVSALESLLVWAETGVKEAS